MKIQWPEKIVASICHRGALKLGRESKVTVKTTRMISVSSEVWKLIRRQTRDRKIKSAKTNNYFLKLGSKSGVSGRNGPHFSSISKKINDFYSFLCYFALGTILNRA